MELHGADFAATFAVTVVLTMGLTPLAIRLALRSRLLDHPSEIKAQESPVPYLGGMAILLAFCVVVIGGVLIRPPQAGTDDLLLILAIAVGLALIGLVDDLRGLSPWLRLAVEVGAGVTVWANAAAPELFANDVANVAVTVLWIVGVTNAFNLLDNMDGLSSGVAAIAAFFVFVLASRNGQFLVAVLAVALAGCALGFLRSNFHPARVYMGDAGALFIGFLLAVLTIKIDYVDAPRMSSLVVPILVLGVPLFDTTLVTVNRLLHRRSPLSGGRDHTSHRMVFVGISVPAVVALIYFGAVSLGVLAVVLTRLDSGSGVLLVAWIGAVALFMGILLSLVPVYETSRRRRLMLREVLPHEHEPPAGVGGAPPPPEEGGGDGSLGEAAAS